MIRKLVVAAAGAGKSSYLTKLALDYSNQGKRVLLLSYTENNQAELIRKFCEVNRCQPQHVTVKGWFTFLLEDLIRPYQRCVFSRRIPSTCFNTTDPHKRNGWTIPGRKEKLESGQYNPEYFLTKDDNRAHTTYLSKLAVLIHKKSDKNAVKRLNDIYCAVFIDEVQDLVGWDFDVIDALAEGFRGELCSVGDFRQTIYRTSCAVKKPQLIAEKIARLKAAGFLQEDRNVSHRCVQPICEFADRLHAKVLSLPPTISQVSVIPEDMHSHLGMFAVKKSNIEAYCTRFSPVVILRLNKVTEATFCTGKQAYNFGEAKGLGFSRVLIIPTGNQKNFLAGDLTAFDGAKTEEARNKFYVAVTRARYSVAFAYDGKVGLSEVSHWHP